MDASQGLGEGGGRRGCGPDYVTSSLCAPPPGPHALVGSTERCGRDSPHRRDHPTPGHLLGMACGRGLCRGQRPSTRHPPPPPPCGRLVCARVCARGVCGGGAVSPLTPETWDLSEPGSREWGPSPFVAKGRWIFPNTSQPRSSGDLCTPKSPTVPLIPFLPQSFFSEALPDFPVRFTASLHCS